MTSPDSSDGSLCSREVATARIGKIPRSPAESPRQGGAIPPGEVRQRRPNTSCLARRAIRAVDDNSRPVSQTWRVARAFCTDQAATLRRLEADQAFEQAEKRFEAAWNRQNGDHPINDPPKCSR